MELFGTAGIRGAVPSSIDPDLALSVGRGAALAAGGDTDGDGGSAGPPAFAVGRDARLTGDGLANAVAAGLQSAGADVALLGRVPTPVLAFASRGRRGVMVTASHNPPADNGLKLFVDGAEYDRAAEAAVERRVEEPSTAWDRWRGSAGDDERTIEAYRDAVVAYASRHGAPLDGLPIAVDAGNGTAGRTTPWVLRALGADVVAVDANPDGRFPGRRPKPTPAALERFTSFVADGAFAFGVAHDGDGDRVVVVDADGEIVHEDTVLAILAEHYVDAVTTRGEGETGADRGPVVVTTPNASARIDERVRAAGGRVDRVRLGAIHEGVAAARAEGATVAFAGEPWKHCHPAFGDWLDGTVTAAVLARLVADRGLPSLREPVAERPYRKENVRCADDAKAVAMERLAVSLPDAFPEADVDTRHGLRLELPDGSWALCRPSGTEPYLRIYVESDRIDELLGPIVALVEDAASSVDVGESSVDRSASSVDGGA